MERQQVKKKHTYATPTYNLTTTHPHLAKEWHPTLNASLKPEYVTQGSGIRVFWICSEGHTWDTLVSTRTKGSGCPYCRRKKTITGVNDLATTHPHLAKEWHPTLNGDLTPEVVPAGSNKSFFWLGACGHTWKARIHNRVKGTNCPECNRIRPATLGVNDLASCFPELVKEWHPTKNGEFTPENVSFGCSKSVWWQCALGHEWKAQVNNRSNGSRCPYCTGKKVLPGFNDLATTHPHIAKEWDLNLNGQLTPQMVSAGSNKRVYWTCEHGHTRPLTVAVRSINRPCPKCKKANLI